MLIWVCSCYLQRTIDYACLLVVALTDVGNLAEWRDLINVTAEYGLHGDSYKWFLSAFYHYDPKG